MRLFTLNKEQWVPREIGEVFPFFANPGNLEELTPPWLHFRILNPTVEMGEGTRIDYKLRLHGIPMRWQSEITVWEPPYRFVDVQTRGPYRRWIHEHRFKSLDGGTLVLDTVEYAVTGGNAVRKFFVEPDLERIFSFRKARLSTIFGGSR